KRVSKGETHVIRLDVPDTGATTFVDLIRGEISFENALIDDQVLLKSDGFPTYHLGVVVDDHLMEISHIIRGEEWISSTPKHILLYIFFGWGLPQFAHVSVLRNPDRSKLSKRKNPVWVADYKARGYLPEVIKNYLATMAWAYPGGKDIFTVNEMIEKFTLEAVQTTAPIFDAEKLRWMNGEYLRQKTDQELKDLLYQYVSMLTKEHDVLVGKILPLIRDRMKLLSEFESLAGFFFEKPKKFERPVKPEYITLAKDTLGNCDWKHDAMEQSIRRTAITSGVKAKDIFMELRIAVTGKSVGPPILESLDILGREEVLQRLTN
ncbi:glutamate--tRNA ligase, partial [Candidatus Gottesmanbacteria bacterium RIFCSPLOWO2_01_FULL_46_9]